MKDVFDFITAAESETNRLKADLIKMSGQFEEEGLTATADELRALTNSIDYIASQLEQLQKMFKGNPEVITVPIEEMKEIRQSWINAGINSVKNSANLKVCKNCI